MFDFVEGLPYVVGKLTPAGVEVYDAWHFGLERFFENMYHVLPDASAERIGWLRVVDESGEDYLYPGDFFQVIDVPHVAEESVLPAS